MCLLLLWWTYNSYALRYNQPWQKAFKSKQKCDAIVMWLSTRQINWFLRFKHFFMVKFLIEFYKCWSIKLLVKFIYEMEYDDRNTNTTLRIPPRSDCFYMHKAARFKLSKKAEEKLISCNFSVLFMSLLPLLLLLWWCIVNFGMIPGTDNTEHDDNDSLISPLFLPISTSITLSTLFSQTASSK